VTEQNDGLGENQKTLELAVALEIVYVIESGLG